jgi:hypothetical protein
MRELNMHLSRVFRTVLTVAATVALTATVPSAMAGDADVIITGGADETQHSYNWQVTNRSNARIIRIEFPQYGADLFETPDTWGQGTQKEMNLVNVGWNYKEPGVCWAEPIPPYAGLAPGATAKFGMRIAGMGAMKSTGTVRIKFDDGTEGTVAGVELPQMPTRPSVYLGPLGMGALLFVFIFVREYRRRKQPPSTPGDTIEG